MKVVYIHQYFRTPEEGGSIRSYYLAKELVTKGIDVEIITASNKKKSYRKNIDGIEVHYLPVDYDNKFGYFKRIWSFLKFTVFTIRESHKINSVALCYIMTTPLTTGFVGIYNKWIRGIPYIFEVGDLWPEVPIKMGIIRNSIFKWLLYKIESLFYKQSLGLVALSPDISNHIKKIAPQKNIEVITNISDCNLFQPKEETKESKLEVSHDEFIITYIGTIGKANHLEYLLEIAKLSVNLPIKFLTMGDGSEKNMLKNLAREQGLGNVEFLTFRNKTGIREVLNSSHATYISFLNTEILHTGSPNKLFDGLAAGKMIISNLGGWTKDLIEKNEVGICYNPENPDEFLEKIRPFMIDRSKLTEYQHNARSLAEKEYSLEILSQKQFNFIKKLTSDF